MEEVFPHVSKQMSWSDLPRDVHLEVLSHTTDISDIPSLSRVSKDFNLLIQGSIWHLKSRLPIKISSIHLSRFLSLEVCDKNIIGVGNLTCPKLRSANIDFIHFSTQQVADQIIALINRSSNNRLFRIIGTATTDIIIDGNSFMVISHYLTDLQLYFVSRILSETNLKFFIRDPIEIDFYKKYPLDKKRFIGVSDRHVRRTPYGAWCARLFFFDTDSIERIKDKLSDDIAVLVQGGIMSTATLYDLLKVCSKMKLMINGCDLKDLTSTPYKFEQIMRKYFNLSRSNLWSCRIPKYDLVESEYHRICDLLHEKASS